MSYDPRSYFDLRGEHDRKFLLIEVLFDAHKLLEQILKELKNDRANSPYVAPSEDVERDPDTGVAVNPWGNNRSSSQVDRGTNQEGQRPYEDNPRRGPGRPRKP